MDLGDASLPEDPIDPATPHPEVIQEPCYLPNLYEWTTSDIDSEETTTEVTPVSIDTQKGKDDLRKMEQKWSDRKHPVPSIAISSRYMSHNELKAPLYWPKRADAPLKTRSICWVPPKKGWYRLDSDGSFRGSSSGVGFTIRKHTCKPVAEAYGMPVKHLNPLFSELEAMYMGLEVAHHKGFIPLLITSDCRTAFLLVRGKIKYGEQEHEMEVESIVIKIRNFIREKFNRKDYKISCVSREQMYAADHLSKVRQYEGKFYFNPVVISQSGRLLVIPKFT
ncbi:hypothetical protein BVC80_8137g2 [Macleaya cordata]|uniref:RNase H type-1 domain-containing protein n=1 Tax=Macleaya cordata TaxID=56857 RepID=A0A200PUX4_MACCD|nr:hypothetical protein BVC80_8137g2 [Macleaya cordata]